jgi:hypothetical protein
LAQYRNGREGQQFAPRKAVLQELLNKNINVYKQKRFHLDLMKKGEQTNFRTKTTLTMKIEPFEEKFGKEMKQKN